MDDSPVLPLMRSLRRGVVPRQLPLVLASGSPRRSELMSAAGYRFVVELPSDGAEDRPRPGEPADQVVKRLAMQKAADVAARVRHGLVLAADTLGYCDGVLLGKPADADDAARMLKMLSGRRHQVLSGVCLWDVTTGRRVVDAVTTELEMTILDDATLDQHLRSLRWQGKAGAFGYQDGNDWLRVVEGSESNVVGLPMERLAELLEKFDEISGAPS